VHNKHNNHFLVNLLGSLGLRRSSTPTSILIIYTYVFSNIYVGLLYKNMRCDSCISHKNISVRVKTCERELVRVREHKKDILTST